MDPLTITASIAGLLSLTIQLRQILSGQGISQAQELAREVEALQTTLSELKSVVDKLDENGHSHRSISALDAAVDGCKLKINSILMALKKASESKGASKLIEKGKWIYQNLRHQDTIASLHRYLELFQMCLTADGM
jgi:predicted RNase H-like nuclease (RuvC/YqgF family)